MIAGSQQVNEGDVAGVATPTKAVAPRKRGCRRSHQVVLKFLPAVEFAVPIYFEFEPQSHPVLEPAISEAGDVLALI